MQKFIPYEKLSKKEKRKRDALRRNTWGALNPVTRKSPDPRVYDRRKDGNGWTIHIPCLLSHNALIIPRYIIANTAFTISVKHFLFTAFHFTF